MPVPILTHRQAEALLWISDLTVCNKGLPPPIEEVADQMGIQYGAANFHFQALEKKGIIKRDRYKKRAVKIL